MLTVGSCCWDNDTGERYPAITVHIGWGSPGSVEILTMAQVSLPQEYHTVSTDGPLERMTYDLCLIWLSAASLHMQAGIGSLFLLYIWTAFRLLNAMTRTSVSIVHVILLQHHEASARRGSGKPLYARVFK